MGDKKEVCIILPTLNEAEAIGPVIDEIPRQTLEQQGYRVDVLVVDGNSADRTREIALSRGARVLIEPRSGKGRAIRTALDDIKADYIFMLDGDYTYPTTYIPAMLEALEKYPVVIGSRLKGKREKGALRLVNFIGNHLLTLLANLLYGTRISDLCTGFWGFRREVIQSLDLKADGFQIEAELLTQIARKGYKIGEIPILYRTRQGKAKLSGWRDGMRIAKLLFDRRFRRGV
ncbi:MAG: glycosyltransferase family 2 protein [Dehalococcoidales bacterium]|jgi:dolichol-phosphate mannosyltransferase|nr:glycosyltransferase family 2 protein [Dehalococcoidales bacterium]